MHKLPAFRDSDSLCSIALPSFGCKIAHYLVFITACGKDKKGRIGYSPSLAGYDLEVVYGTFVCIRLARTYSHSHT